MRDEPLALELLNIVLATYKVGVTLQRQRETKLVSGYRVSNSEHTDTITIVAWIYSSRAHSIRNNVSLHIATRCQ
jgi:hypothetical protein